MRCSRKARWLIPLSSIGEVAHFAIRANLHIDALTMLKDAWQSIVGRCAVFLFRVFRLLLQTYDIILNDMFPRVRFPQAPLSKILIHRRRFVFAKSTLVNKLYLNFNRL